MNDIFTIAQAETGLTGEEMEMAGVIFNANSIIGSVFSLTNNIGLVIPAFAGILVCSDYSNGTLRNKVIAGNRRSQIYLSHLIVSVLFSVILITIYAAMTTGLALLFFPFNRDLGTELLHFVVNGLLAFVFRATVSTLFALVLRSIAPTIIFTIVVAIALTTATSVIMLTDYESFRHVAWFVPTFVGNFYTLGSLSLAGLFGGESAADSGTVMFVEGMLSYLFFGAVNTVIGLAVFGKRDIK